MRRHDLHADDLVEKVQQIIVQLCVADRNLAPRAALFRAAEIAQVMLSEVAILNALRDAALSQCVPEYPPISRDLEPFDPLELLK